MNLITLYLNAHKLNKYIVLNVDSGFHSLKKKEKRKKVPKSTLLGTVRYFSDFGLNLLLRRKKIKKKSVQSHIHLRSSSVIKPINCM